MAPTRSATALIEHRERLAGVETRTLSVAGEGPPLLLLHGYADSADTWRAMLERFADGGPGGDRASTCAGSEPPTASTRAEPLLPQWDAMVDAAVAELGARPRAPGVRRRQLARRRAGAPGRRARRSCRSPGSSRSRPPGLHMAGWFSAIEGEWLVRLLQLSPVPVPDRIVKPIVGRVYRTLAFGDPGTADPEVVDVVRRRTSRGFAQSMGVLDTGRRLLPELERSLRARTDRLPAAAVWGERDRMVFTTGAERVLRTVDYSDIEVIPDCGHCPQVEVPDVLAELLLGFPGNLEYAPVTESARPARSGRGGVGGRLVDLGRRSCRRCRGRRRAAARRRARCRRSARRASARRARSPTSSRSRRPAGGGR